MKNEDKRIKDLYTEAFDSIHASDELKRKLIEMNETDIKTEPKKGKVISMRKFVYITAAVVALALAGGMVAAKATKGPYEQEETVKIIFNGEEKDAYFHEWSVDTVSWRFEVEDKEAWIYVTHSEPVDKNTQMYVTYNGEYIIASDVPEPTLNLYTDIDRSPIAEIGKDDYVDQTALIITTEFGTQSMTLAVDEADGTADGVSNHDGTYDVFTVMSDGSIAEATIFPKAGGLGGFSDLIKNIVRKSVDNYEDFDPEVDNPYEFDSDFQSAAE